MKKIISLILLLLALSLTVIGCAKPLEPVVEDLTVEEESSEEEEISTGLEDLDDIDSLETDLEEDLGLDGLENLNFE